MYCALVSHGYITIFQMNTLTFRSIKYIDVIKAEEEEFVFVPKMYIR